MVNVCRIYKYHGSLTFPKDIPEVKFGGDIQFKAPKTPLLKSKESRVSHKEKITSVTATSETATPVNKPAVYDRDWLLM